MEKKNAWTPALFLGLMNTAMNSSTAGRSSHWGSPCVYFNEPYHSPSFHVRLSQNVSHVTLWKDPISTGNSRIPSRLNFPLGCIRYVLCHSHCRTVTTLKGSMQTVDLRSGFRVEPKGFQLSVNTMRNNNGEWDMLKVLYMNLHSIKNPSSYNYHIFANIEILDVRLNI